MIIRDMNATMQWMQWRGEVIEDDIHITESRLQHANGTMGMWLPVTPPIVRNLEELFVLGYGVVVSSEPTRKGTS